MILKGQRPAIHPCFFDRHDPQRIEGPNPAGGSIVGGDRRSRAEFIAKLGTVLEEADESLFWLELMVETKLVTMVRAERLLKEADELTAIFTAALKTPKG